MLKIYLIAQPNAGKTTLFNRICGERCYVANWPGKTVEVHQARFFHHGIEITLTDLPGINSFKTASVEEGITKEFIFSGEGIAVILVNGESLFRSIYFAVQVLELRDAIVVINKADYLEKRGVHVNVEALKARLGTEVVLTNAIRGIGINQLLDRCIDAAEGRIRAKRLRIDYGSIEQFVERAEKIVGDRGIAVKALEGDDYALSLISGEARSEIKKISDEISELYGDPEQMIAVQRYRFVEEVLKSSVKEVKVSRPSERLDSIFFSRAGPFFAAVLLFLLLFASLSLNTGFPLNFLFRFFGMDEAAEVLEAYSLVGMISGLFDSLSENLSSILPDSAIKDLIVHGIIPGVGAIASFFPLVLILNFLMSLVEDSGLMARFAVSMDRLFSFFGLTGKSSFPFGISVACNVPGAVATRILETDSERIRVALAIPFIICQARLLILVLFAAFLFSSPFVQGASIVFLYILSALLFLSASRLYAGMMKLGRSDLLIELPPYHFPSLRVSWWITWQRSRAFIFKVGKFLLFFSVILWLLNFLGISDLIGKAISAAFSPMNFSPELCFSLFVGFFAKELIISSLAVSFGTSDFREILSMLNLSFAQSLALLVFISFYTPCAATVATVYSETRSIKLLAISVAFQLFLAYLLALATYSIFSVI
jgi:ferrous iron transport protein B